MYNCFPDKLCLGCAVRFLETTIIATRRMTVKFVVIACMQPFSTWVCSFGELY